MMNITTPVMRKMTANRNRRQGMIQPRKKMTKKRRKHTNEKVKCAIAVGRLTPHQGKGPPL
jgi:hypothetical protein